MLGFLSHTMHPQSLWAQHDTTPGHPSTRIAANHSSRLLTLPCMVAKPRGASAFLTRKYLLDTDAGSVDFCLKTTSGIFSMRKRGSKGPHKMRCYAYCGAPSEHDIGTCTVTMQYGDEQETCGSLSGGISSAGKLYVGDTSFDDG